MGAEDTECVGVGAAWQPGGPKAAGKGKMIMVECGVYGPHSGDQVCQALCTSEETAQEAPECLLFSVYR